MQNAPKGASAILSTFIKLPFVIKIFVLSIFEWSFYTGFTVLSVVVGSLLLHPLCVCLGMGVEDGLCFVIYRYSS